MLLNDFLKEHSNVEEQQAAIAQLKATAAQQQKQIEALTATAMLLNEFLNDLLTSFLSLERDAIAAKGANGNATRESVG